MNVSPPSLLRHAPRRPFFRRLCLLLVALQVGSVELAYGSDRQATDFAPPPDVGSGTQVSPGPINFSVSDETALDLFLRALGASSEPAARALLVKAGLAEDQIAPTAMYAVERAARGRRSEDAKARLVGQKELIARLGDKTAAAVMAYCRTSVKAQIHIVTPARKEGDAGRDVLDETAASIVSSPDNYCPGGQGGLAPYCSDACNSNKPCDKLCRRADETCSTCGEYGSCEGSGGGGGGGGGGGTITTYDDASYDETNVYAYVSASSTNAGTPLQTVIEFEDENGAPVSGGDNTSGNGSSAANGSVNLGLAALQVQAPLGAGGDAQNPQQLFGFLRIIAKVLSAGVYILTGHRIYRQGTGMNCYVNAGWSLATGCEGSAVCISSHEVGPTPTIFYPSTPTRGAQCAPQAGRRFTWRAFQIGSTFFFNTSTGYSTVLYPSGGCTCQ